MSRPISPLTASPVMRRRLYLGGSGSEPDHISASCEEEFHADRMQSRYREFLRPQRERHLWITSRAWQPIVLKSRGLLGVRSQKQRAEAFASAPITSSSSSLDHLQMAGARLAALGDELVADLLRFVEGRQTSAFDRADMNEHILRTVIRLDEAEALLGIEPLNFACRHIGNLSSCAQTGGPSLSPYSNSNVLRRARKGQTPSKAVDRTRTRWGFGLDLSIIRDFKNLSGICRRIRRLSTISLGIKRILVILFRST